MKKLLAFLIACLMTTGVCVALAGCDGESQNRTNTTGTGEGEEGDGTPTSVTINALDKNLTYQDFTVPYNPQRIACLDFGVLDVLDQLGLGDRVVAAPGNTISYLQSYVADMSDSSKDITNVGSLRTINTLKLNETEPDIIFISERHAGNWAVYEKICPGAVVLLSTDENNMVAESRTNAKAIASIFGIEESVIDDLFSQYRIDERISAIRNAIGAETENPKSFLLVLYSGESDISLYGDKVSCCSIIGHELGFKNAYDGNTTYEHGESINWETFRAFSYDYVIVLNRGYVVTPTDPTLGNSVVKDVMMNKVTDGYLTDETLVVLSSPSVWYQAKWGILALDAMLSDFEAFLGLSSGI